MSAEAKHKRFQGHRAITQGCKDLQNEGAGLGASVQTKRPGEKITSSSKRGSKPDGTRSKLLVKSATLGGSSSSNSPSRPIAGFALPASARIKKRRDFLRAQDRGFRFYTKYFTMYWLRLNTLERPRLGITVSTKVHKRSTRRNRIKRIVREVFRLRLQHALPESGDLIVIAKPAVIVCTFREIEEDLVRSLARLEFSRRGDLLGQDSTRQRSTNEAAQIKGRHGRGIHGKGIEKGRVQLRRDRGNEL